MNENKNFLYFICGIIVISIINFLYFNHYKDIQDTQIISQKEKLKKFKNNFKLLQSKLESQIDPKAHVNIESSFNEFIQKSKEVQKLFKNTWNKQDQKYKDINLIIERYDYLLQQLIEPKTTNNPSFEKITETTL